MERWLKISLNHPMLQHSITPSNNFANFWITMEGASYAVTHPSERFS